MQASDEHILTALGQHILTEKMLCLLKFVHSYVKK